MTLATAAVAAFLWARSRGRWHAAGDAASPPAAHAARGEDNESHDDVELRRLMA